jgi:acetate CoA/acetoacetate CoA-transferase alpha subunit
MRAPGKGVGKLFDAALLSTLTASHIGLNPKAQQQVLAKQIVCRRARWSSASAPAVAVLVACSRRPASGQLSREGKQRVQLGGKTFLLETALRADFALIHVSVADHWVT